MGSHNHGSIREPARGRAQSVELTIEPLCNKYTWRCISCSVATNCHMFGILLAGRRTAFMRSFEAIV